MGKEKNVVEENASDIQYASSTSNVTPVFNKGIEPLELSNVKKEEQVHIDAAAGRVKAVQSAIDAAKVVRDEQLALGVQETDGVKLDREVKEKADLKEAAVVNKLEPFGIGSSPLSDNSDLGAIVLKVNELIKFLNK